MKQYKYKINGSDYDISIKDVEENIAHVEVNGTPYIVEMEKKAKPMPKPVVRTQTAQQAPAAAAPVAQKPAASAAGKSGLKTPLPGVIREIKVNVGDMVKKGQTVIILEAMKMENSINSDRDGKVSSICVSKGDSVLEGADLLIIE
jgi:biotin carboxyl carrier protein